MVFRRHASLCESRRTGARTDRPRAARLAPLQTAAPAALVVRLQDRGFRADRLRPPPADRGRRGGLGAGGAFLNTKDTKITKGSAFAAILVPLVSLVFKK